MGGRGGPHEGGARNVWEIFRHFVRERAEDIGRMVCGLKVEGTPMRKIAGDTVLTRVLVATVLSAAAGGAFGQVRQLQTGNVMDANSGVGTGGTNRPVP